MASKQDLLQFHYPTPDPPTIHNFRYGDMGKQDFKRVWEQSLKRVQQDQEKFLEKHRSGNNARKNQQRRTFSDNNKGKRPRESISRTTTMSTDARVKRPLVGQSNEKWAHLWFPEYDETLIDFDNEEIYFEEEITESDIERDEEDPISFNK